MIDLNIKILYYLTLLAFVKPFEVSRRRQLWENKRNVEILGRFWRESDIGVDIILRRIINIILSLEQLEHFPIKLLRFGPNLGTKVPCCLRTKSVLKHCFMLITMSSKLLNNQSNDARTTRTSSLNGPIALLPWVIPSLPTCESASLISRPYRANNHPKGSCRSFTGGSEVCLLSWRWRGGGTRG